MNIPQALIVRCRQILLECNQFDTHQSLKAIFVTPELESFRNRLPESLNKAERVSQTIDYLSSKYLDDNRPVLPLFLSALRDLYNERDRIFVELNRLYKEINQVITEEVVVPFVIAAMNNTQATNLFNESIFDDPNVAPIEREQFQNLRRALNDLGLRDLLENYKQDREAWIPPVYPDSSISQIIFDMLKHINEHHRKPHGLPRLLPNFVSDEFFEENVNVRRWVLRQLKQLGGIIVVDAVSMFHPLLRKSVSQSGVGSNERVALLVLSPIDTNNLPVNQLIEQLIARQLETAFSRFDDEFDHFCEIGVGNLRTFKRWLFNILPEAATNIQMENPSPVTKQRWRNEQNREPRGFHRVIFRQGNGQ